MRGQHSVFQAAPASRKVQYCVRAELLDLAHDLYVGVARVGCANARVLSRQGPAPLGYVIAQRP
jgi:hypothetical protein